MGVAAGRGAQHATGRSDQLNGAPRAFEAGARHHHLPHAGSERALHYQAPVGVVTVVREVDPDVEELGDYRNRGAHRGRRASQRRATSSSGWFHETTKRASPEPVAPQS